MMNHWLAPRLATLQAEFPELRIALIGEAREASLSRREADLALRLFRPRENALVARKLAKVTYGLYGSKEYLSGRLPKDLDFLGHDESEDHLPQHKWLRAIAGDREFALRANDLSALLGAVRAGLGVAVLPQTLARHDKALKQVPTAAPAPTRDLWLVFHRDVRRVPAIRAVIDHLTAIIGGERAKASAVPRHREPREPPQLNRTSALFLLEQPELGARLAAGNAVMPKNAGTRRFCSGLRVGPAAWRRR